MSWLRVKAFLGVALRKEGVDRNKDKFGNNYKTGDRRPPQGGRG